LPENPQVNHAGHPNTYNFLIIIASLVRSLMGFRKKANEISQQNSLSLGWHLGLVVIKFLLLTQYDVK